MDGRWEGGLLQRCRLYEIRFKIPDALPPAGPAIDQPFPGDDVNRLTYLCHPISHFGRYFFIRSQVHPPRVLAYHAPLSPSFTSPASPKMSGAHFLPSTSDQMALAVVAGSVSVAGEGAGVADLRRSSRRGLPPCWARPPPHLIRSGDARWYLQQPRPLPPHHQRRRPAATPSPLPLPLSKGSAPLGVAAASPTHRRRTHASSPCLQP